MFFVYLRDNLTADLSSSCSINIDQTHNWSLSTSNYHQLHSNRGSLSINMQDSSKG